MVESEWNKDPYREELVLFIYLSLKEKTRKRPKDRADKGKNIKGIRLILCRFLKKIQLKQENNVTQTLNPM